ncbi:MAG: ribose-phosphate diphosphokinase, partial [Dehalococcoidia bacterium]|nr:ribose-phosphate diphosphokinase [Dehalococcoidia bacterium]
LEHVTAVPLLIDAVRPLVDGEDAVVVAPDLGAVKLAARFADALGCPMAAVHKLRLSGSTVATAGLTGEVRGRTPVIVDDMVTTGGTIEAAAREALKAGSREGIVVAVTHSALEPDAAATLERLPLANYVTTNTAPAAVLPADTKVVDITALLADVILRLTNDASLGAFRADT